MHYSADVIVEIEDRNGNRVPMHALLDTGMSATIILHDFVTQGKAKVYKSSTTTQWKILGGMFNMNQKALLEFRFPELSQHRTVEWKCHVDRKTDKNHALYDMIIGIDLMTKLGIWTLLQKMYGGTTI